MRTLQSSHSAVALCWAYPRTPALAAQARFLNPSHFVTAPFRGMPAWQASAGRLRCFDVCDISLTLRRAACAAPSGSLFPTLQSKVPRPRRCSDEHFLVKPFGGGLVPGISPDPCDAQVAFRLCRAKSRDRAGPLMRTLQSSHSAVALCWAYPRTPALAAQARFLNPSHY